MKKFSTTIRLLAVLTTLTSTNSHGMWGWAGRIFGSQPQQVSDQVQKEHLIEFLKEACFDQGQIKYTRPEQEFYLSRPVEEPFVDGVYLKLRCTQVVSEDQFSVDAIYLFSAEDGSKPRSERKLLYQILLTRGEILSKSTGFGEAPNNLHQQVLAIETLLDVLAINLQMSKTAEGNYGVVDIDKLTELRTKRENRIAKFKHPHRSQQ